MNQMQTSRFIAPAASRILRPGIRSLANGVHRHVVKGQGSLVVPINAGDKFKVTDLQGGQICEVLFFDGATKFDLSAISAKPNGTAEGLKAILASGASDAEHSRKSLERRGINLGAATSLNLFSNNGRAGDHASFDVSRDGFLIVVAPAADMAVDGHKTATDIELLITRANPKYKNFEALPDPLADPLQDIRIKVPRPMPMW